MSQGAGASQRPVLAPVLLQTPRSHHCCPPPPTSSLRPPRALVPLWILLPLLNHTQSPPTPCPSDLCLQTTAMVTIHQPPNEVTAS